MNNVTINACSVCWGTGRTIDDKPCPWGCMPNIVTSKPEDYGLPSYQQLREQIATLTRQRDLAVEALEDVRKELQQSNDRLNEEREIWDRVMGDGVKKLERLELELDDCLYVLESLSGAP